jgi:tetratricopeptide (TPR) repeat protein
MAHDAVLLYASSGSGKTSLINAGLIPKLAAHFNVLPPVRVGGVSEVETGASDNVFVSNAIDHLIERLAEPPPVRPGFIKESSLQQIAELAQPSAGQPRRISEFMLGLHALLDRDERDKPLVLIFDQFEELFTSRAARRQDRDGFFQQVTEVLTMPPPIVSSRAGVLQLRVLFAMREDFLAEMDPYIRWMPESLRPRYRLKCLGGEAALQVITKPVQDRLRFEPDSTPRELVDKLIDNDGYVDPVQLSVVCWTMCEKPPGDKVIREVPDIGGALQGYYGSAVDAAAGKVAECATCGRREELGRCDKSEQCATCDERKKCEECRKRAECKEYDDAVGVVRRWFEKVLLTESKSRGIVPQEAAGIPSVAVTELDESWHIIRPEKRGSAIWYELAHDRLIEPILDSNRAWRGKHGVDEDVRKRYEAKAKAWDPKKHEVGLLTESELDEALQKGGCGDASDTRIWPFIQTSMAAVERKRRERSEQAEQAALASAARERELRTQARKSARVAWVFVGVAAVATTWALLAGKVARRDRNEAVASSYKADWRAVEAARQTAIAKWEEEIADREKERADSFARSEAAQAETARAARKDAQMSEQVAWAYANCMIGETTEARRLVDTALAIDSTHPAVRRVLAFFCSVCGRYDSAKAVLTDAERRWPSEAWVHQDLAALYLRRAGLGDSALAAAEEQQAPSMTEGGNVPKPVSKAGGIGKMNRGLDPDLVRHLSERSEAGRRSERSTERLAPSGELREAVGQDQPPVQEPVQPKERVPNVLVRQDTSIAVVGLDSAGTGSESAYAYIQQGDLTRAKGLLRDLLRRNELDDWAYAAFGLVFLQEGEQDSAGKYLERAIEINPSNHSALGLLANVCVARGDTARAITALRKAVRMNPEYAYGFRKLGEINRNQGRLDSATVFLMKAVDVDPSLVGAYGEMALVHLAREDTAGAMTELRKALRIDGNYLFGLAQLGELYLAKLIPDSADKYLSRSSKVDSSCEWAYTEPVSLSLERGDTAHAIAVLRTVARIDPDYLWGYWKSGELYRNMGELDSARAFLTRAIQHDSLYPDAHGEMALVHLAEGDTTQAFTELRVLNRIDTGSVFAFRKLGELFRILGMPDSAEEYLARAIRVDPYNAKAYCQRGLLYLDGNDTARAIAELREAVGVDSSYLWGAAKLGEIYLASLMPDSAEKYFARSSNVNGSYEWAYTEPVSLSLERGDTMRAIAVLRAVARIDPDYLWGFWKLGRLYRYMGKLDSAEVYLKRANKVDPSDTDVYDELALVYLARGDTTRAIAEGRASVRADSEYTTGFIRLAQLYRGEGELDSATACLTRAIEIDSSSAWAHGEFALVRLARKDTAGAVSELHAALRIDGSYLFGLWQLGQLYSNTGMLDSAMILLTRAVDVDSSYTASHGELALVFLAKNDTASAIAELRTAIRIDSSYPFGLYALGPLYFNHFQYDSAYKYCRLACRTLPGDISAEANFAEACMATSRFHQADSIAGEILSDRAKLDSGDDEQKSDAKAIVFMALTSRLLQGDTSGARVALDTLVRLGDRYGQKGGPEGWDYSGDRNFLKSADVFEKYREFLLVVLDCVDPAAKTPSRPLRELRIPQ